MALNQLKGTKEYLPNEQAPREKIVDVIKKIFKKYGFQPVETTILEYFDVAANKYAGGEEILKEAYKLNDQGERSLCLRYELTFKLAKLIGLNPNVKLPLKRYEIGKVFRDGPVKVGRLREFTQCDVDVVGTKSVAADAELVALCLDVFKELNLDVIVKFNNRKLLFGLFDYANIKEENYIDAALSLDKLEKVGEDAVKKELTEKGIDENSSNVLFNLLNDIKDKNTDEIIKLLESKFPDGQEGLNEIKEFYGFLESFNVKENVFLTPSLARGLGYYTGMMYEVFQKSKKITSSLAAGGRWDKMIQSFLESKVEYPATGISFGLDTVKAALESENSNIISSNLDPLVLIVPINTVKESINIATKLRQNDISCDVAIDKKLSKALDYADKKSIPFTIVVGEEEIKNNVFKLKDMKKGDAEELSIKDLINKLKEYALKF